MKFILAGVYKILVRILEDFPLKRKIIKLTKNIGIYQYLIVKYTHIRALILRTLLFSGNDKYLGDTSLTLLGGKIVSRKKWNREIKKLRSNKIKKFDNKQNRNIDYYSNFNNKVSVISSLYRSDKFLECWIENLKNQTIFKEVEFNIVSVEPSEFETKLLNNFQKNNKSNVNVIYSDLKIGIYEAWNIALLNASGNLITNANVDDLRRCDSLEIQRSILSQFPFIDVTYQDILFSLSPDATWSEIERLNQYSNFPHVTLTVLTKGLHPPHHAPMWRKSLHEEFGLFDETFQSAGDFDFWFRCFLGNKTFFKSSEKHVSYFYNPKGLSTKRNGSGLKESIQILKKYQKLIEDKGVRLHELKAEGFSTGFVHTILSEYS